MTNKLHLHPLLLVFTLTVSLSLPCELQYTPLVRLQSGPIDHEKSSKVLKSYWIVGILFHQASQSVMLLSYFILHFGRLLSDNLMQGNDFDSVQKATRGPFFRISNRLKSSLSPELVCSLSIVDLHSNPGSAPWLE